MTTDAPAASPASAPLASRAKVVVALGGAVAGLGVTLAGITLPWGVLTYPIGESDDVHNLYIVAGLAGLLLAVAVSWLAFRWVRAARPWLAALVGVAILIALATLVSIVMSVVSGLVMPYSPVPVVIGFVLTAVGAAFLYLLVGKTLRRS